MKNWKQIQETLDSMRTDPRRQWCLTRMFEDVETAATNFATVSRIRNDWRPHLLKTHRDSCRHYAQLIRKGRSPGMPHDYHACREVSTDEQFLEALEYLTEYYEAVLDRVNLILSVRKPLEHMKTLNDVVVPLREVEDSHNKDTIVSMGMFAWDVLFGELHPNFLMDLNDDEHIEAVHYTAAFLARHGHPRNYGVLPRGTIS